MKIWTIIVFALLAAFGVGCMLDVQESSMAFGDDKLGVAGFPRIVGAMLAAAAAFFLIQTVFQKDETSLRGKTDYRAAVALAASIAYILGVCYLGFRVSTVAYLLILPPLFDRFRLQDKRSLLRLAAYALCVTLAFHFFFGVFKVYLPPTILF